MEMAAMITKINRILGGLMNCQLEFQPVESLPSDQWDSADLQALNAGEDLGIVESRIDSTFGFPVNLHGRFAGLAVIRGWKGAKDRQVLLLAELLTSLLENEFTRAQKSEKLSLIEERLRLLQSDSNVVLMRPPQKLKPVQQDFSELPEPLNPLNTLPLLIETKPGFPLHRIAVEIHQTSGRWAMLSVGDLPADIFDSRESLKELGSITLFIPDLTQLSANQQLKLGEYLATKPSAEMPHVIAGLSSPLASLTEQGSVLPHLAELFCHTLLQWSEKSSAEITRDWVEATLQHLLDKARESVVSGTAETARFLPFHVRKLDPDQTTVH